MVAPGAIHSLAKGVLISCSEREGATTFKVLEEMTCSTEGRTSIDAMGG
jgi:hypothetical protein